MFRTRREGQPVRYGFNFYPWSDKKWHIGFKLKYWKNRVFAIRYSGTGKKLFVYHITVNSTDAFMKALR